MKKYDTWEKWIERVQPVKYSELGEDVRKFMELPDGWEEIQYMGVRLINDEI